MKTKEKILFVLNYSFVTQKKTVDIQCHSYKPNVNTIFHFYLDEENT